MAARRLPGGQGLTGVRGKGPGVIGVNSSQMVGFWDGQVAARGPGVSMSQKEVV